MERLARLEIERAVLDLHEDVVAELAVERHELHVGALDAIRVDLRVVDERPPHHDAAVRRDGVGEHVGAVGVRAAVVLRSRLALAVGLDDEAAEVGNQARRSRPPWPATSARRPGRADRRSAGRRASCGAAKFGREVDADAVRPQRVARWPRPSSRIRRGQRLRVGVDAVDDGAVDADRRVRARVVLDARIDAIVADRATRATRPA